MHLSLHLNLHALACAKEVGRCSQLCLPSDLLQVNLGFQALGGNEMRRESVTMIRDVAH
jgi:hypothetical protein